MNTLYVIGSIWAIFIYCGGISIFINNRTGHSEFHMPAGKGDWITEHRSPTPKDAWLSLCWPLFSLWIVCKMIIFFLNSLVAFPLLLIGINIKILECINGLSCELGTPS